jgi:hypothetical protein
MMLSQLLFCLPGVFESVASVVAMSMFNRIFGKPKEQANSNALATLDKLNEVTFLSSLFIYRRMITLCFFH